MSDPIGAALSILAGIGGLTGCTVGLICYALSVPLSPLIIGSITTVVSAILASASFILVTFMLGGQSSNPKRDSIVLFSQLFFPQVVIGIGLSAAINAVPGITLDINSAANLGVIIGFATPILGSVDKILEKPYKSSNKIEKTHKNLSSFIKSGKNAPKIFNFTKKTLNQMTFFVDMLIVIPLHFSIPFWRNNYCTSLVFKTCNKGIAIVALVGYYSRVIDTFG